jgi:hypothetical protein
MKTVASLLAGTAFAVTIVLGAVQIASALIVPEQDAPRFTGLEVADLWTMTPVRVDPEKQSYERLPPRYGSGVVMASASTIEQAPTEPTVVSVTENLDVIETGAVTDTDLHRDFPALSEEHVSWCHARYRSYSIDDNNYMTHSGELRTCMSPYSSDPMQGSEQTEAILIQDGANNVTPVAASSAHAQNCLQRYRSYRAEDNSYQPYGGGPRKQCELRTF